MTNKNNDEALCSTLPDSEPRRQYNKPEGATRIEIVEGYTFERCKQACESAATGIGVCQWFYHKEKEYEEQLIHGPNWINNYCYYKVGTELLY